MAGSYENPGWVNSSSPSINETNLNAMSDAVVENQGDIADLETMLVNYSTVETYANRVPTLASKVISRSGASIPPSAWEANSTFSDYGYGYRASITMSGVTTSYIPMVIFMPGDAISGNYAPSALSYNGGVYVYAKTIPQGYVGIVGIVCVAG